MPKAGEKIKCPRCRIKSEVDSGQRKCNYCGYPLFGKPEELKKWRKEEVKKEKTELGLCPFSWITQEKGCLLSPQKVWEPVKCLGSRCQLWDMSKNDCVINNLSKK